VGSSIDGVIVSVLTSTLKVSTLTITPPMLEPTIYYTQSKHTYYYTIDEIVGSSIGGVIVSVLTLSEVDRGFEHRWCNSKRADFECSRSWVRASMV
jgi:uncharacterized membrane protein